MVLSLSLPELDRLYRENVDELCRASLAGDSNPPLHLGKPKTHPLKPGRSGRFPATSVTIRRQTRQRFAGREECGGNARQNPRTRRRRIPCLNSRSSAPTRASPGTAPGNLLDLALPLPQKVDHTQYDRCRRHNDQCNIATGHVVPFRSRQHDLHARERMHRAAIC